MTPLSSTHSQRRRSLTELFLASAIWGFAFVTTVWALPGIGPVWMTSVRFLMAAVMLHLLFRSRLSGLEPLRYSWRGFRACLWPGFFLFALLALQSAGLKYTSATKCGFITVLYVLIVPFLERLFLGRRIARTVWLWIALALAGTTLICAAVTADGFAPDFLAAFNVGDGLTLLCAFAAAGHLMVVNRVMGGAADASVATGGDHARTAGARIDPVAAQLAASPVTFHVYQCVWIVLFAAIAGSLVEGNGWVHAMLSGGWDWKVWVGLAQLGLMSSAVAFLIQVRAQRFLSPTTVGLMVLLESPWAMLFSIALLDERLTGLQLLGAGLILIAAIAECIQQARPADSSHSSPPAAL